MNASRGIPVLIGATIGFGITFWFVWRREVPTVSGAFEGSNGERSTSATVLTALFGFAITLVGVALGAIYRRLLAIREKGPAKVRLKTLVVEATSSVDFYLGLVGAPLVFGLLWQSLGDISFAGLTVMALQNGFTSHAIVGQIMGDAGTKQPSASG